MIFLFLFKCFLVGISAASAVGPIFVLTFNNGALRGFKKGFFTALGAALGDGFLLFLGVIGVLNFIEESHKYQIFIDFAGGFLLLIFGISILLSRKNITTKPPLTADTVLLTVGKIFLYTVLNPLTLFFFMFISTQILATGHNGFTLSHLLMGSLMTALGSLSVLTTVAFVASSIGNAINQHHLRNISIVTGSIILAIGGYFFFDAIRVIFKILG